MYGISQIEVSQQVSKECLTIMVLEYGVHYSQLLGCTFFFFFFFLEVDMHLTIVWTRS